MMSSKCFSVNRNAFDRANGAIDISLRHPKSTLSISSFLRECRKTQRVFRVTQRHVNAPINPSERLANDRKANDRKSKWMLLFVGAVSLVLFGCAAKPQPVVDVYMEPVVERSHAQIDTETGAMTLEQKGVAVTLQPLTEVDLFALTDEPWMNPYLVVERNGAVEPLYTVFEVTVQNLDASRVQVADDAAVLIDKNGAQHAALPYDYFERLYDDVDTSRSEVIARPYYPYAYAPYRYPYHYAPYSPASYYYSYVDVEALEEGRSMAQDSIFAGGKLFRGAKRRGLLIFDRLEADATEVRLVVSGIRIIPPDGQPIEPDFKFDFKQVVAVKR